MSTDLINDAGLATRQIKGALHDLKLQLATLDTTCNTFGVLMNHSLLLADLDEIIRATERIQTGIINTHWPTETEYREV